MLLGIGLKSALCIQIFEILLSCPIVTHLTLAELFESPKDAIAVCRETRGLCASQNRTNRLKSHLSTVAVALDLSGIQATAYICLSDFSYRSQVLCQTLRGKRAMNALKIRSGKVLHDAL